jgi:hypothetical protein
MLPTALMALAELNVLDNALREPGPGNPVVNQRQPRPRQTTEVGKVAAPARGRARGLEQRPSRARRRRGGGGAPCCSSCARQRCCRGSGTPGACQSWRAPAIRERRAGCWSSGIGQRVLERGAGDAEGGVSLGSLTNLLTNATASARGLTGSERVDLEGRLGQQGVDPGGVEDHATGVAGVALRKVHDVGPVVDPASLPRGAERDADKKQGFHPRGGRSRQQPPL